MSIKSCDSPIFSQMYDLATLRAHVASFQRSDIQKLEGEIYRQAVKDGVLIESWDLEWGKNHLFEDTARLVKVLFERKKKELRELFNQICSAETAELIVNHCPLVLENLLSHAADVELVQRADVIAQLDRLKYRLGVKCSGLFLNDAARDHSWRAIEVHYLTLPLFMDEHDARQLRYLTSIIAELLDDTYDSNSVEIILDRLLNQEMFHPTSKDLSNHLQLKSLRQMTFNQLHNCSLQHATESLWKSIHIIPSQEDKQGKFKPLDIHSATNEVYGFQCDRIFGFGMTAPTALLSLKNIFQLVNKAQELLRLAHEKVKQGKLEKAQMFRQHAFNVFNDPHIPQKVRNSIFGETYFLYGNNQVINDLGQKLFCNRGGYSTSDLEKSIAIQNYLMSNAFKNHVYAFIVQGTIQPWIHECGRAYDLIVKDPSGGEKLKSAPKVLVHLYALLGMIKGSMDCSSGNTLIEYSSALGRVVNFWDFDDERSMPTTAHFRDFRLWQMGLPQCAQPFNKAILLMFSHPKLLKQLLKQQTSPQIPKAAYEKQLRRLEQIALIFQEELNQEKITLTPHNLFFKLFEGEQEYETIKSRFSENKMYDQEGIPVLPIELFEFHLPRIGCGAWYTHEEGEKALVEKNMRALYFPPMAKVEL